MLGIMFLKMWHKKWMNICLLLGCILLVATVVSFPIYQDAAYNRMLQDEFNNYVSENGSWPGMIQGPIYSKKDAEGKSIASMESFITGCCGELGVTEREVIMSYKLASAEVSSEMNRRDAQKISVKLSGMTNLQNKVKMLSGEVFSDDGMTDDGYIEVIISQSCLVDQGLLVGEKLQFTQIKDFDGNPLKVYISGVFAEADINDFYWYQKANELDADMFMNFDLFKKMFVNDGHTKKFTINCLFTALFDYDNIKASQIDFITDKTDYFLKESKYRKILSEPGYVSVLDEYNMKKDRIATTLIILQVPVLVMLAAFLLMISGQMYEMEKNEISVIKSRGSSGFQIFKLYLYQGLLITIVGAAAGIPLGALFSRVLGATRNFLEFDSSQTLEVTYTKTTWIYAGFAMLITLLSMTLPAIKHSKVTIVKLKQSKAAKRKSWWEKFYIDILLVGVSLYGFYSFNKNSKNLAASVLSGESLDPLLYLCSSVFIVGVGLLFLRIQPYLVSLIYLIGKRFWGPASHVSFMENIKNGRKQQLIMLFMIMTISLGMYHATVARTILQNAIDNREYLDGADIILEEVWTEIRDTNLAYTGVYVEPDYSKYADLECAENYTRVYYDEAAYVNLDKNESVSVILEGIHTKNFGQLTMVSRSLLSKAYYEYLNELAVDTDGILVSSNFASKLGYKVGDSITYYNSKKTSVTGKIVDFVDYWPGYAPVKTVLNPDGSAETTDNYLIVTHYDLLRKKLGVLPYEIWISLKDGYDVTSVVDFLDANDIRIKKFIDKAADMKNTVEDPLLQGTNGILTMGFVVTIVLCAVGYLIYWVMAIRERELIFGVLRACGFHKGEVFRMILNEQIFSGVFSILAGIGIGKLTSKMFVPIVQQAYQSVDQVLPMKLITNSMDMYRLYMVIGGVMIVCLIVLVILLFKMNVTKALKLGEE